MNEKQTCVSIITVVYNAVSAIEETILSIISQSYTNFEYIIIDGGSTDGTIDIIKKYDKQISTWISETDNGIYDAMNKGIDLATGEWINFMNAGDSFYESDTIEKFVKLYDNQSDIVYGKSQIFSDAGIYINNPMPLSAENYLPTCHQAFFVKTDLLKSAHFDTKYKICADRKFFYDAYKMKRKFQYIPLIICNYEDVNGFSSTNYLKRFAEIGTIEKTCNTTMWKIEYALLILKYYIKKLIPQNIIVEIHKRKLNKTLKDKL